MIEERLGGGEHRRPPRHFTVTDHADPLALHQGLDDVAVDRHATHILDLTTGDRLTVGNQGHGLQQRTGVTLWTLLPQAAYPRREIFTDLQPIAAGHSLELERSASAGFAQHFQGLLEDLRLGALGFLEQLVQTLERLRLARGEQKSLDQRRQVAGVIQVHRFLRQTRRAAAHGWAQKAHSAPVRSATP
ncbi:hypothetical protein D3C76_1303490 [compost metagenome]